MNPYDTKIFNITQEIFFITLTSILSFKNIRMSKTCFIHDLKEDSRLNEKLAIINSAIDGTLIYTHNPHRDIDNSKESTTNSISSPKMLCCNKALASMFNFAELESVSKSKEANSSEVSDKNFQTVLQGQEKSSGSDCHIPRSLRSSG